MIHYDGPRFLVFLFFTNEKFLLVFVLLMHFMLLFFFEEFLALEKAVLRIRIHRIHMFWASRIRIH